MTANDSSTSPIDYTNEEWKDIPGYEGYYQVSNLGRVRSLDRAVRGGGRNPGTVFLPGRILKPRKHSRGYLRMTLSKEGINSEFYIHRLVCTVFFGGIPKDREINHINGNKTDNRISNLEIVTRRQNTHHAVHVLKTNNIGASGGRNPAVKLKEKDVLEIRRLYATGKYTQRKLAKIYGVCFQNIHQIVRRKGWKAID